MSNGGQCCVCLEKYERLVYDGRCNEGFCLQCTPKIGNECPNCRQRFPWAPELIELPDRMIAVTYSYYDVDYNSTGTRELHDQVMQQARAQPGTYIDLPPLTEEAWSALSPAIREWWTAMILRNPDFNITPPRLRLPSDWTPPDAVDP